MQHRRVIRILQRDPLDQPVHIRGDLDIAKAEVMVIVKPIPTAIELAIGGRSRIGIELVQAVRIFIDKHSGSQLPVAQRKFALRPALGQIVGNARHRGIEVVGVFDRQLIGDLRAGADLNGIKQFSIRSYNLFGDFHAFDVNNDDLLVLAAHGSGFIFQFLQAGRLVDKLVGFDKRLRGDVT